MIPDDASPDVRAAVERLEEALTGLGEEVIVGAVGLASADVADDVAKRYVEALERRDFDGVRVSAIPGDRGVIEVIYAVNDTPSNRKRLKALEKPPTE